MIFILFIMDISSIWGMIKDAVNVSRIFSHTELKQKFIEALLIFKNAMTN